MKFLILGGTTFLGRHLVKASKGVLIGEFMLKYGQLLLACVFAFGAMLFGLNCLGQENGGQQNSAVPAASISLKPCEVSGAKEGVKEKVRCGTFEVFEDRIAKSGRKIALKIVVFPATGQATGQNRAADPLVYIPGGPGSSATEDAPFVAQQFAKIREHRDLVFVDQRGTGGSKPLHCDLFYPAGFGSYLGFFFSLLNVRHGRGQIETQNKHQHYTPP